MKIGLLVNSFNRPEYLSQTLDSLAKADLSGVTLLIVDDCSTNPDAIRLIQKHKYARTPQNRGIKFAIEYGMNWFFEQYYDVVINLDSDTIVKPDFVSRLMDLHRSHPNRIISGFNTMSRNKYGIVRHPVVETGNNYVVKNTIGGVNMLIPRAIWKQVRDGIHISQRNGTQWDREVCAIVGGGIIVSVPSCVQHIGHSSSMGHHDNPDIAEDFETREKLCVIQPHGLGDIIFCQTLVRSLGYKDIVWPVVDNYIEDCNRAYPDINFISHATSPVPLTAKTDGIQAGFRTLPIRWSDSLQRVPYKDVMRAKYDMYGMKWKDWKDGAMWVRDNERERSLFRELGLRRGMKYTVANTQFGWRMEKRAKVSVSGSHKIVELRAIEGYSLFDWAMVLEQATEIHTVSTSILFILDLLQTGKVHVYLREPDEVNHDNYSYLFQGKYVYH